MNNIIIVEGIDKLGKSFLIEGIQRVLGPYPVIHFGKPQKSDLFDGDLQRYQKAFFQHVMSIIRKDNSLILDRSWIGEAVYSPLYRETSGNWVFDLERLNKDLMNKIRLILLVEDFDRSNHFISDGDSFDDTKRREEQELFIEAFKRSIIPDKRMVCVTDPITGGFKPKELILEEVL